MAHDGNLRIQHGTNHFETLLPAFELHRLGVALPDETSGIVDRFFGGGVIAEPWHVADDERIGRGAGDSLGVIDHLVNGHAEGVAST